MANYEGMDFLNNTSTSTSEPFKNTNLIQVPQVLKNFIKSHVDIPSEYPGVIASKTDDFCTSHAATYLNVTCQIPIDYALVMYGYIAPFLLVLTVVANTFIVAVLSRPHMRSPTNVILMAIALCDMLTTLLPAPWNFYMYTLGNHYKPLGPVAICTTWKYMTHGIPHLFHTASVWMTLALAVHQYICVCHTPLARTWCTMPRVVMCLVCISVMAFLYALPIFMEQRIVSHITVWGGHFEEVCKLETPPWVRTISIDAYYTTRYMFSVLFVHLIPCTSLVVLNILLIRAMKTAKLNRQKLFKANRKTDSQRLRDYVNTTWMLIAILTVYLLAGLPVAIVTVLHVVSVTVTDFLDYSFANKLLLFTNFFILFFFPVNFVIYSTMSRQFRETFKGFFIKSDVSTSTVESGKTTELTI